MGADLVSSAHNRQLTISARVASVPFGNNNTIHFWVTNIFWSYSALFFNFLSDSLLSLYPSNFILSVLPTPTSTYWVQLVFLKYSWVWGQLLEWGQPNKPTPLKKLSIVKSYRDRGRTSSSTPWWHSGIFVSLRKTLDRSCPCYHNHCELVHMANCPVSW